MKQARLLLQQQHQQHLLQLVKQVAQVQQLQQHLLPQLHRNINRCNTKIRSNYASKQGRRSNCNRVQIKETPTLSAGQGVTANNTVATEETAQTSGKNVIVVPLVMPMIQA